jgi:hypothetical protein
LACSCGVHGKGSSAELTAIAMPTIPEARVRLLEERQLTKGVAEQGLALTTAIHLPTRVWKIRETKMHLEGFDFIPGRPNELWHAQGKQVDRYELEFGNPRVGD